MGFVRVVVRLPTTLGDYEFAGRLLRVAKRGGLPPNPLIHPWMNRRPYLTLVATRTASF